ncbi:hypothetical protein SLEP1_g5432 [Rubroshorea leprosula]|uniref:Glycosyltransferase n=1 Tax=Rubroshorea leprosula TaxID=152421 RepID=A0AAV5HY88_9ROSI|nr:hypothetical protein SLEP1_g5432 [Rubroshorea leprosula]
MDSEHRRVNVLLLPWLAHGHISPFLELAKRLATRNFDIHFCSTPFNITSIKQRLLPPNSSASIHFVELHLPPSPELPPPHHTANALPPHLMSSLKTAFNDSTSSFTTILKTLNPDLLIHDYVPLWAPVLASSMNIPAVQFLSVGATMASFAMHFSQNPTINFPFPSIYLRNHEQEKFKLVLEAVNRSKQIAPAQKCPENSSNMILIKSFREIEGKYIDYLSALTKKKVVTVGPLVQDPIDNPITDSEFIKWLDKKEPFSTVFVSFGSEYCLCKEEIEEIAHGLEQNKVNFIWVLRFHVELEKIGFKEALPEGFIQRVGNRGKVDERWAPQSRILGHRSIGGFVSHCGWSSVMESMKNGVPIIAMPMHFDQPLNARLVEEVGVGIEVKRDGNGRLHRKELAEVIRAVVKEESETGEKVRRRAKEVRECLRCKGDGGMDDVAEELFATMQHTSVKLQF